MRATVLGVAAAALLLAGCGGGGSGEVTRSASVVKADVSVDAELSWASCGPVTSSEPDTRPEGEFFADDAPSDGDLVPGTPVAAAFCTSYVGFGIAGGTDLLLSGSSLDALVFALDHAPQYDGSYDCVSIGGPSSRVVLPARKAS